MIVHLLLALLVGININSVWAVENYGLRFYELATLMRSNSSNRILPKVHLIRIPKASSSSLSAVARRMVGCNPPGPCCKWPGDPVGSCPRKELFECQTKGKVIGCTHHNPNYQSLLDKSIVSISIMREPQSRSISAFFYPGIHHNSQCTGNQTKCFLEYTRAEAWRNIGVKMLTGLFAYSTVRACEHISECPHSLELAISNLNNLGFMGIAEMWELSLFLLHYKFKSIPPVLGEFLLTNQSESMSGRKLYLYDNDELSTDNWATRLLLVDRENHGINYAEFKKTAMSRFAKQLHDQNVLDIQLYEKIVSNMCHELHSLKLWSSSVSGALIQEYWRKKSPVDVTLCM